MARKSYKTNVKKGQKYYFEDENMIVHVSTISAASEHYIGVCITDKNGEPFTFTVMDYALSTLEMARHKLAMEIVMFICAEDNNELSANEMAMIDAIASELTDGTTNGILNQMINELSHDFGAEQFIADDLLAHINILRENNK